MNGRHFAVQRLLGGLSPGNPRVRIKRGVNYELIDPYHSAAMLSLGGTKALFSHGKPRPDANSVRGLPCKNKAFYSPETQHGRRVIKVCGEVECQSFFICSVVVVVVVVGLSFVLLMLRVVWVGRGWGQVGVLIFPVASASG